MSNYVLIKDGSYRNQPVKDVVVPLIKNYQDSPNGGFITVEWYGGRRRIKVLPTAYKFVDESDYNKQEIVKADISEDAPETSDDVRIQEKIEKSLGLKVNIVSQYHYLNLMRARMRLQLQKWP